MEAKKVINYISLSNEIKDCEKLLNDLYEKKTKMELDLLKDYIAKKIIKIRKLTKSS